jgi:thioredoxin-like negative regulator of GroEL
MAPVVHGLEEQYRGWIDFLYLNVAEARNDSAERALGFRSTPHFFFLRSDGAAVDTLQGVIPSDSMRVRLERLLIGPGAVRR